MTMRDPWIDAAAHGVAYLLVGLFVVALIAVSLAIAACALVWWVLRRLAPIVWTFCALVLVGLVLTAGCLVLHGAGVW
ncbi:hypothetical protein XccvBFoX4_gp88 [Xanthomonas phage FoX4]|uniref:Uncharacterized protein n=1 Tax=Xanthomonas phage FoX4 TaxID=2723900 RepID=A0A858WJ53_9CAUD|nr:hypothetical protein KNU97_gp88 [Xanthomonas phage FoX4]QJI53042.1 hypothetical protein XccvBFoX4_gp88 [Xanthomonas phage FoX4]